MEALRREEELWESRSGVGKMAFERWLKVRRAREGEGEEELEGELGGWRERRESYIEGEERMGV